MVISKRKVMRLVVLFWFIVVGFTVYNYFTHNMKTFYILLATAVGSLLLATFIFLILLIKNGIVKDMIENFVDSIKLRRDMKNMDRIDRIEEKIEKRFENRIKKLEEQQEALVEKVERNRDKLTDKEIEEYLNQYKLLIKQQDDLEELVEKEIEEATKKLR